MAPRQTAHDWAEDNGQWGGPSGTEISGLAVTALVLGVLGFVCFPGVAGIAAVAFGIAARGDIAQSGGRRSGLGLANAGIIAGGTSVALTLIAFAALIAWLARPRPHSSFPPPSPVAVPSPPHGPSPSAPMPVPSSESATFHAGVRAVRLGSIYFVDLGPGVTSLGAELDAQRARAEQEERKLLLWVSADKCLPCNGVATALRDPRLQRELDDTLIVRLDVQDYRVELESLDVPTQFVPGFALLDTDNRPVDYVHGGEWNDDIPQNIAPVLGAFVRGTYRERRHPWQTLPHANTTPI